MNVKSVLFVISVCSLFGFNNAGEIEAAIEQVFKNVLGLHPPIHPTARRPIDPPKHMLALYQKFISGKAKPSSVPNTVRNILPIKGPASMADLILFNVSCVEDSEEVRLGQLHLNRRRLHQRHFSRRILAPPYRVRVYRVSGNRLSSLGSIPVAQANKAAWHTVDITSPLREFLLNPHNSHLLGIRFEAPKGKPLTPKHFLRETYGSTSSFLVIFSEESSENDVTDDGEMIPKSPRLHTHDLAMQIQSLTDGRWLPENNDLDNMLPDPSNLSTDKITSNNFSTLTTDAFIRDSKPSTLPLTNNLSNEIRQRRSVEDNELPGVEPRNSSSFRSRKKGRRGNKDNKKSRSNISSVNNSELNYVEKSSSGSFDSPGTCRLRKLNISFADIGWNDWIVQPATFQANFCSGSCLYPTNKHVHKTRHALIESKSQLLVVKGTPSVCDPYEVSPIPILHVDNDGNYVLSIFPDMKVESCICS